MSNVLYHRKRNFIKIIRNSQKLFPPKLIHLKPEKFEIFRCWLYDDLNEKYPNLSENEYLKTMKQ